MSNQLARKILKEIARELSTNDALVERISAMLQTDSPKTLSEKRSHRRTPGVFDPMAVYRETPDSLPGRLRQLTTEQLKDIVAEHGMDRSKLAMKWKDQSRLIDLILNTVKTRSEKGDAFWSQSQDAATQEEKRQ